jgi:hypothetical protein
MDRMVGASSVAIAVAALSLLAGCSSDLLSPAPTPAAERWVCSWDPTMNHDWHDDYLCTKGDQTDRPHLIPGDGFVDRDQIDQAAADYEAKLNS